MERIGRAVKMVVKWLRDTRGVSLYEITAAVAMTGILAAVAVPVVIERTTEARAARVVQEVDAVYKAITQFQQDTGKFPGQGEGVRLLLSGPQGFFALLPAEAAARLQVVAGVTVQTNSDGSGVCAAGGCANINDYLVRDPNTALAPGVLNLAGYPKWKGPYMDELFIDQWDRAYIANVAALYQGDQPAVAGQAAPPTCGFAWVLSGGPDRILATSLTDTSLNQTSDDIGKNNGKKIGIGSGC